MTSQTFRVGIIGYGLSAKVFQIPYIQSCSGLELHAIVQRSGDDAAKEHPHCAIYRSAQDLFQDEQIEVVVIATSPTTHFELASAALNAGKHVVVEKPFCPTSSECDQLISLAEAKDKILTVFHNRRWDADYLTLRQILSQERVGHVVEFESHFDRYVPDVPPRDAHDLPGSGVVYDLGTHLIDQMVEIYGIPEAVTAIVGKQRLGAKPDGAQDSCTIWMHYKTGLVATVKASPLSVEKDQLRFWIRGSTGSFRIGLDEKVDSASESGTLTVYEKGELKRTRVPNLPSPTYREFYDQLVTALSGNGAVPVDPRDARTVIRIIELSNESAQSQKTVAYTPK